MLEFIQKIVTDIEIFGYSECFTHAHTYREQHTVARVISEITGMRVAVELNKGLVEVVL